MKKCFLMLILSIIMISANAQYSNDMNRRALPEHTLSISGYPVSKGYGIMYDRMIFSTRSMVYATLAADNFGIENSEASWAEHLCGSIGLEWCTKEQNPEDPQLRVGAGIKYSSLHTVNGCQSPTMDLSDLRPEVKIAIRIEKWFTFGIIWDIWEANSCASLGVSF